MEEFGKVVDTWGCSSNGRAPALHAGGTGIDTLLLQISFFAPTTNTNIARTSRIIIALHILCMCFNRTKLERHALVIVFKCVSSKEQHAIVC